jgi:hypothetical protein
LLVTPPFSVAGQTHAYVLEVGRYGKRSLGLDVGRVGLLDHLEVWRDLVECDLLDEFAVIPNMDIERVGATACGEGGFDRAAAAVKASRAVSGNFVQYMMAVYAYTYLIGEYCECCEYASSVSRVWEGVIGGIGEM